MTPELTPLALLWALVTGHPDAWLIKGYADSARVPAPIAWAMVTVESGHAANNSARGRHGEIGRWQIKRIHESAFRTQCGSRPLTDYATNLCVGAHLLRRHYDATGSWELAIRRYNGTGRATDVYLQKVQREMGTIALRLLEAQP